MDRAIQNPKLALLAWLLACPWLLFPTLSPTLAAVSLLLLFLVWLARRPGRSSTPLDGLIAFYLALTAVAFLASPLPETSLPKLTVLLLGVFGYYLALDWLSPGVARSETGHSTAGLHGLAVVMAAAGAGAALVGLFTVDWPARQVINLRPLTDRLPHLSGPFSLQHNELAHTLLLTLPFAVYLWQRPAARWQRWLAAGCLALLGLGLLLAQSRGAIVGLVAATAAWLLWRRISWRALLTWLLLLVLIGPLLLAGLGAAGRWNAWVARLDAASRGGGSNSVNWVSRLEIWRVAGEVLGDYPALGAGLYTFDPVSRANYVYDLVGPDYPLTHAHNLFLQTGVSLGWAGWLALAWLWLTAAYGLWRAGRAADTATTRLVRPFAASLVGYLTLNLVDLLEMGQKPGVLIWLLLAGCVAIGWQAAGGRWQGASKSTSKNGHLLPATCYLPPATCHLLPVLLLLLLSPTLPRNLANLRLDRWRLAGRAADPFWLAARLEGDTRRLGLLAFQQGDREAALGYWSADPQATLFLENQGRLAVTAGDLTTAFAWYDLGLTLDPTAARLYFWRGLAHEKAGEPELALADYEAAAGRLAAASLSGEWQGRVQAVYGRLLADQGRWKEAQVAFE
ncbi:MAG: O-antigen ligase family protein, partial [Chloroflexota bacterium]